MCTVTTIDCMGSNEDLMLQQCFNLLVISSFIFKNVIGTKKNYNASYSLFLYHKFYKLEYI